MSLVPPKNDPQAILNSVEWFYDLYKDYVDGVLDTSFSMPKDAAEWYVEATINRANILLDELHDHYTTYDTLEMGYEFLNNENIDVEDVFYLMTEIQDGIDNLESEGKLILPYSSVSFEGSTKAAVAVANANEIETHTTQPGFTAGDYRNCDNTLDYDARHLITWVVNLNNIPVYTPGQFGTFLGNPRYMEGRNPRGPNSSNNYCSEIYHVNPNATECNGITPPTRSSIGEEEDCIPPTELQEYIDGANKFVLDENINSEDLVFFNCDGARMSTGSNFLFFHTYWVQYGVLVVGPVSL